MFQYAFFITMTLFEPYISGRFPFSIDITIHSSLLGISKTSHTQEHFFTYENLVMQAMRSAVPVNACAMYFINGLKRTGLCEKHRFLQPDYVKNKDFYSRIM